MNSGEPLHSTVQEDEKFFSHLSLEILWIFKDIHILPQKY